MACQEYGDICLTSGFLSENCRKQSWYLADNCGLEGRSMVDFGCCG